MKRTFLSGYALALTLSLSACGGGAGGGGGGGGAPTGNTFNVSGMSGDATRRSTPEMSNSAQTANAWLLLPAACKPICRRWRGFL